ncbi:branched-chain amino acid ABC transporter permease [Micromonospora inositola]|uniref:Amino acid/amide ABC transporter membrane protein 2, HAAT family n=1 Tax=Micromonospora inositola TaxID=47865 RepID=A0A1C5JNL2_9ACTN|nr:branched-chain amino acid ABC transporter permease [Micromonospora inositola]SCG72107.1 amino acid/amide ABC transporter membrane protein 2, HAAT family [Micromonospora inositola]
MTEPLMVFDSWFATNETTVQNVLIAALLAFSVQVALRAGIFSLAGIGFYAIGSYSAGLLSRDGHSTPVAVAAAMAIAAVVSLVLAFMLVRLRSLYLAMATVSFDLIVVVVATNWHVTGAALGIYGIPLAITTAQMGVTVAVAAAGLMLLERGTIGRTYDAIREDEELAQSFAVNVQSYRRLAFVVSGVLGALAGSFHALSYGSVLPGDAGFSSVVLALTMVIIGGSASWFGALLGAVVLTWVPLVLTFIGDWWDAVYGGLLVLVACYLPNGLLGAVRHLRRLRLPARRQVASEHTTLERA